MGRIVYKEQDNVYGTKISDMDLWIDPTSTECPAKYMNHSCEPNCNLEQWAVDGLPRMCFFAIEDINSDEELTYDYNGGDCGSSKQSKCGKPKCCIERKTRCRALASRCLGY